MAAVRVGQHSDFDKLTLDIETDGSIDLRAALGEAAEILIAQLALFTDTDRIRQRRPGGELENSGGDGTLSDAVAAADPDPDREARAQSYNCLKRAAIQTIGDLITKSENELNAIPNLGQKSIDEVIQTLHDRGLNLRGS